MSGFDPAKWVEVADNLGMDAGVAEHPDAPGCWLVLIGAPCRRTHDTDALLEVLRPADREQAQRNEKALADYLLASDRYEELD